MNKLINSAAAARKRFTDVKAKGFRKALAEDGAIDLASIMVGVLVIGIIGGVIAATVFAVIPWSQDQAASQALDAVATAESVAFAQSSGEGAGFYLDEEELAATDGLGGTDGLIQSSDTIQILVTDTPASYEAFSLSPTGKVFSINSANPADVVEYADLAAANTAITALVGELTVVAGALVFTPAP